MIAHSEKRCVGKDVYWFDCKGQQSDLFFHCDDLCENGACLKLTWTDPTTNLVWMYNSAEQSMYLPEAGPYCDSLTLAGLDDWRLPTVGELRSIISGCSASVTGGICTVTDTCAAQTSGCNVEYCSGCANDAGPNGQWYLSVALMPHYSRELTSTVYKQITDYYYAVDYHTGQIGSGAKSAMVGGVRCVRGTASKPL